MTCSGPTGGPTTGISKNSKEKYLASSWSMKVGMKLQRTTVRSSPGRESLVSAEARMNAMLSDLAQVSESLDSLNGSVANLGALRVDLESIRQALNSGDSTVLGLVGRLEYMEQSMESVNAHRLQINETLFRLQKAWNRCSAQCRSRRILSSGKFRFAFLNKSRHALLKISP